MATWSPALDWRPIVLHSDGPIAALARFPASDGVGYRLAGVQYTIKRSWWYLSAAIFVGCLVFGVVGFNLGPTAAILALWANAALLTTTFAHELGHAFCGASAGLRPRRVVLFWLGGMTAFVGPATEPRQKALSAIGGPAANIVLGIIMLGLSQLFDESPSRIVCLAFAAINGAFAASNLLPIPPQDGGILLEAAIWARIRDPRKARALASRIGTALGVAFAVIGGLLTVYGGGWLSQVLFVQGALTLVASALNRGRRTLRPAS